MSTSHKLYILGQFGDGEGGGDPCPNFLAHWRSKKVVQVVQIRERGDGGGETPAQILWHIGVQQMLYKLSKLGGGGLRIVCVIFQTVDLVKAVNA